MKRIYALLILSTIFTACGGGTKFDNLDYDANECIPKDCSNKPCGIVDDGCGNKIDCSICGDINHPYLKCSKGTITTQGKQISGTKNICGGGVTLIINNQITDGICSSNDPPYVWAATDNRPTEPPFIGCLYKGLTNNLYLWCCPNDEQ